MTPPQIFSPDKLQQFAAALLRRLDLPDDDAALVARALAQADLEGIETHGLGRLPNYVARLRKGLVNPRPQLTFVQRQGATALLDADNGMGQVAATRAMEEAIRLASEWGVGWVAVRHSNHFGVASFYGDLAAVQGMLGLALSNTPPAIAPTGGAQPFLGTNPIALSAPRGDDPPISIDLATSAVARGHVIKAAREGRSIPPDWAVDAEGQPTTDPNAALKGALLPLGGAKGYALALGVELLCGTLTGAAMGPEMPSFFDNWDRPSNVGHTLIALNIAAFMDPSEYAARSAALVKGLKAVPPAPGAEGVRLPGERRAREVERRRAEGVPLAAATVQQLNTLAQELGVTGLV